IESIQGKISKDKEAVTEVIINNIRQKIIREHLIDPAFYEQMSALLKEVIKERRANALEYKAYLKKLAELAKSVIEGTTSDMPAEINTPALRALYNNLNKDKDLAVKLHSGIVSVKPDGWRGNPQKENVVKGAIYKIVNDETEVERIFSIVKHQNDY
ncbi:MAG: restriction endonuclease subunit R, partial [Ignavibacteria bacterium]|nr:restriction endonuclease subunit R [Ignavibacteria bacterium]